MIEISEPENRGGDFIISFQASDFKHVDIAVAAIIRRIDRDTRMLTNFVDEFSLLSPEMDIRLAKELIKKHLIVRKIRDSVSSLKDKKIESIMFRRGIGMQTFFKIKDDPRYKEKSIIIGPNWNTDAFSEHGNFGGKYKNKANGKEYYMRSMLVLGPNHPLKKLKKRCTYLYYDHLLDGIKENPGIIDTLDNSGHFYREELKAHVRMDGDVESFFEKII